MMGTTTGSAPYLTVNHGRFYIDTFSPPVDGALDPTGQVYRPRCVPKQDNVVMPEFDGQ